GAKREGAAPGRLSARGVQQRYQALGRHETVALLDEARELLPVDARAEVDPQPAAVADVRRAEEEQRVARDQRRLRALRRRQPQGLALEAVVLPGVVCEHAPLAGEPARPAVAEALDRLGEGEAELAEAFEVVHDVPSRVLPGVGPMLRQGAVGGAGGYGTTACAPSVTPRHCSVASSGVAGSTAPRCRRVLVPVSRSSSPAALASGLISCTGTVRSAGPVGAGRPRAPSTRSRPAP